MISEDINKTHYDKPIQVRQAVAQLVVDTFSGKELVWGKVDCFRILAFTLRHLGHSVKLTKIPKYSDPLGAMRALKTLGYSSLEKALDDHLFPIGSASVLPADIIGLPGENGWIGLCVVIGNGRAFGFIEDHPTAEIIQPTMTPALAWRSPVKDMRRKTNGQGT